MTASDAWHSLDPTRALNDPVELRKAFVKLDLDGNGSIDKEELRMALISMQGVPTVGFAQHILDEQVDAMISWADLDQDGMISFEEYKKVIQAGCLPDGGRIKPGSTSPRRDNKVRNEPIITHDSAGDVIHL